MQLVTNKKNEQAIMGLLVFYCNCFCYNVPIGGLHIRRRPGRPRRDSGGHVQRKIMLAIDNAVIPAF